MEEQTFREARLLMVEEQIEGRGISDPRVLEAMREVPRHEFVPPEAREDAYKDGPLPIGYGQTISQPYIVGLMTELLHLKGHEKVLEIGTGSGYQAAILGRLARQVVSLERHPELAQRARHKLAELGLHNVEVLNGDGSRGLAAQAPFQAILVTAAAPRAPQPLLEQLDLQGRLVVPVGDRQGQDLHVYERSAQGIEDFLIAPVAFVPLRGQYGWREEEWGRSGE